MQASTTVQRAFICHASEDKEAFAKPISFGLLARGIDVWLDQWEMQAGDSLVQRIFEQGIRGSSAMIVLLSPRSIVKPWVNAELDVGVINRIEKSTKLIPVLIEKCEVPMSLKAHYWVDVERDGGLERVAEKISDSILGVSAKPPLAKPASSAYVRLEVPGLRRSDEIALQLAYEAASAGHRAYLQVPELASLDTQSLLSEEALQESVEVLAHAGYLSPDQYDILYELPASVYLALAAANGVDVGQARLRVAAGILNQEMGNDLFIAQELGLNVTLVEALLDEFKSHGFLQTVSPLSGEVFIHSPTASFRRWFEEAAR